jgi:hypothetical protein
MKSNRNLLGYQENPAIIFCAQCFCHWSADILKEFANHVVSLVTHPRHTSPMLQALDVLVFGRVESAKNIDRAMGPTIRKQIMRCAPFGRLKSQQRAAE